MGWEFMITRWDERSGNKAGNKSEGTEIDSWLLSQLFHRFLYHV